MKDTFLIYKPQKDGGVVPCTATAEEWLAAVNANRNLPTEQRRYFISDCIEDGKEMDRMIIEVGYDEYRRWNSRHTIAERSRKADEITLLECLSGTENVEAAVIDEILMNELKKQLSNWKPWASDMLEQYLAGKKRTCSADMAEKYGVSEQVTQI